MQVNKIRIESLEVPCKIGVSEEERSAPQQLIITVELAFDFSKAAQSSLIQDTIDYVEVASFIREQAKTRPFELLESLAYCLHEGLRRRFAVDRVNLWITKEIKPLNFSVTVECGDG